jgi:LPS export ABC transporter permease LptG
VLIPFANRAVCAPVSRSSAYRPLFSDLKLLDRYVLRSFFEPFIICTFGFLAIWLIFDLSDNGPDFIAAKASLKVVGFFYLTQLPAIILIVLPVGLLLAMLFSLSRMSRTNEIISQLTAGRSVVRVVMPLIFVGLLCTGILGWLNYELAPHADAIKKVALEQISKGQKSMRQEAIEGHLFRDRMTGRTWYCEKYRMGSNTLQGVVVVQQDEKANIVSKWYARRADYDPRSGDWGLIAGMKVEFDTEGNELRREDFSENMRRVTDWSETPWRISSSNFEAQNLSVPELRQYLTQNHDFPEFNLAPYRTFLQYRHALPWTCLVVVLIAAPLGIVYNRRGVLAGVASSIFIFFGMIFSTNLFLALGKGMRVSAAVAAWTPNAVIALIGLFLLYLRSTNRDFAGLFIRRR